MCVCVCVCVCVRVYVLDENDGWLKVTENQTNHVIASGTISFIIEKNKDIMKITVHGE